jgi:hypothetical protein
VRRGLALLGAGTLVLLGLGIGISQELGRPAAPLPPAPELLGTPNDPTTQTRAQFRFRSAHPAVRYSCRLDGARALPFTIGGTGRDPVYPGGPDVPVDLVFTNPNAAPITVTGVRVTVTGMSEPDCHMAGLSVVRQLAATPAVPAGATRSLSQLGIDPSDWPQLRLADNGNQNACRGATIELAFSGTATG